mmetsp:Transcript_90905/g.276093  ORF Transcript_90905/g.276093 Transcript_90905/m.276093 type:complete len:340 (-) Transcript_90905:12-1031(-)
MYCTSVLFFFIRPRLLYHPWKHLRLASLLRCSKVERVRIKRDLGHEGEHVVVGTIVPEVAVDLLLWLPSSWFPCPLLCPVFLCLLLGNPFHFCLLLVGLFFSCLVLFSFLLCSLLFSRLLLFLFLLLGLLLLCLLPLLLLLFGLVLLRLLLVFLLLLGLLPLPFLLLRLIFFGLIFCGLLCLFLFLLFLSFLFNFLLLIPLQLILFLLRLLGFLLFGLLLHLLRLRVLGAVSSFLFLARDLADGLLIQGVPGELAPDLAPDVHGLLECLHLFLQYAKLCCEEVQGSLLIRLQGSLRPQERGQGVFSQGLGLQNITAYHEGSSRYNLAATLRAQETSATP